MSRVIGAKAHSARLRRMTGPAMTQAVGAALYAGGNLIEIEAEHSITAGSASGKGHVPSAPGQPPNRDTGVLDGNIETARTGPLKVEVSSNAPYALALELGTSRMEERPYMRPATAKRRAEAVQLVRRAVKKVLG